MWLQCCRFSPNETMRGLLMRTRFPLTCPQVHGGSFKAFRIVVELPESEIAAGTQQSPNSPCRMAVIDVVSLGSFVGLWIPADCTASTLLAKHSVVIDESESESPQLISMADVRTLFAALFDEPLLLISVLRIVSVLGSPVGVVLGSLLRCLLVPFVFVGGVVFSQVLLFFFRVILLPLLGRSELFVSMFCVVQRLVVGCFSLHDVDSLSPMTFRFN